MASRAPKLCGIDASNKQKTTISQRNQQSTRRYYGIAAINAALAQALIKQ